MSKIISDDHQSHLIELRNEFNAADRPCAAYAITGILRTVKRAGEKIEELTKEVERLRATAPPGADEIRSIVRQELSLAFGRTVAITPPYGPAISRALAMAVAKDGDQARPFDPFGHQEPQWPDFFETKDPIPPARE